MARKKRRKKFRVVRDQNFLEFKTMPPKANRAEVIAWMKESPIINYVVSLVTSSYVIISYKEEETDRYIYVGWNYGKAEKVWFPGGAKTGWGEQLEQVFEKDGIDLMPPLYHTLPGKEFSLQDSEIAQWLKGKTHIYELVYLAACYNKVITFNTETGCFEGACWHMMD
ncbi:hypothetical protein [Candidatus Enterococcus clewellii]|uniref:Uncharacterized protein n=1 Tax=Candidatus Enterococcus clewellii TaxID=1834193 RepID=A0A242JUV6_9ENTE|nr:hypothetical protein [Enterococcus sp. 9E7_DIV0242]OTP06689.1 hypothetical protein A5888_004233 [Enterococcus sp. 9E7_DIV0242]